MVLYTWLDAAAVPLLLREEARRVALHAAERLGLARLTSSIRVRWFRRLGDAEGAGTPRLFPPGVFSLRWSDCLGYHPADDPTCICVRCDVPTDAALVTVAHEVYHVAERLWGVRRADAGASEREADAFARLVFRYLYGRPPVL